MPKKKLRINRRNIIVAILAILWVALAYQTNFPGRRELPTPTPPVAPDLPNVTAQDLYFEIDLARQVFHSRQSLTLVNTGTIRRELSFLLHPNLVIDQIGLTDAAGKPIQIKDWQYAGTVSFPRLFTGAVLNNIVIHLSGEIAPHQTLTLHLEYHLKPIKIQNGAGPYLYELYVSQQMQRAIGFDSGAFPILEPDGAAPLTITIKRPADESCGVPGEQVSEAAEPEFTTTTYRSPQAYDPAFSCEAYTIERKSLAGASVDFYLIPGQHYDEAMGEIALTYFQLYRQLFGDPGVNTFRFVYVEMQDQASGGESKGNTFYISQKGGAQANLSDEALKAFKSLVGHEEFHMWNAFYATWNGKLRDWWVEGGATFMSAWAGEQLWGIDFGRFLRSSYLARYNYEMTYLTSGTLEYPNDVWENNAWKGEWTLTYYYGALVWEQLRLKVGDEALTAGLSDYMRLSSQRPGQYLDFVRCLNQHTQADVAAFLEPWITHNARIDLSFKDVAVRPVGDQYETTVTIDTATERDYEIFTTLGYKTAVSRDWEQTPVHITRGGTQSVTFTSPAIPLEFQIDPDHRVPQTNIQNDVWPVLK